MKRENANECMSVFTIRHLTYRRKLQELLFRMVGLIMTAMLYILTQKSLEDIQ